MTEQTQPEPTLEETHPTPLKPLVTRIQASAHNQESIRYDLGFHEAVLRFVDAQIEPMTRQTEEIETLEEEAGQRFTFMILADCIDRFVERIVEARLKAAGLAAGKNGDG